MKRAFFWLLFFFGLAFLVDFGNQVVLVPLTWSGIALMDRRAFRVFQDWKFMLFLGFVLLAVPLVCGEKQAHFLGIPYSRPVFESSVVMAQRSVILLLALRLFTGRVSAREVSEALQNGRFRAFGLALSLAVASLPQIRAIAAGTFREVRLARGREGLLSGAYEFLVKLLVRLLCYADSL